MVFGDAGAQVIAKNMKSEGNNINCIQAGEKVECIFGFCDIREFTATTECLREKIMQFVNTTAAIVHGAAKEHRGFPNKNVGDAFLMVWRPPQDNLDENAKLPSGKRHSGPELWEESSPVPIADHAYMTILESIEKIDNCQTLKDLTLYNAAINERMPNYRTKLGFGLHAGWAIEGAIGSNVKVDCSYLGPHMQVSPMPRPMARPMAYSCNPCRDTPAANPCCGGELTRSWLRCRWPSGWRRLRSCTALRCCSPKTL